MEVSDSPQTPAGQPRQTRSRLPALSHQILLCAGHGRPTVEFLNELAELLLSSSGYDALELWPLETRSCSRWAATRKPRRFMRLDDATVARLEEAMRRNGIRTSIALECNAENA